MNQEIPKHKKVKHAVFGYGSLISTESAAKTAKSLTNNPFPCTIRGIERAWNKRSIKGMTAMGVQFNAEGSCIGVLYPVTEKELKRFDRREKGYQRHEVPIENVDVVDYLGDDHYHVDDHKLFLEAVNGRRDDVRIWVYVPENPMPPDVDHPIAQTYVDIILQGCLDIHADFAREFIEETKGWDPSELLTENEDDDEDENEDDGLESDEQDANDVISWVNDRDRPIYMRADTEYSQKEGPQLDALLREYRPEFRRRKRLRKKKGRKIRDHSQMQCPDENY